MRIELTIKGLLEAGAGLEMLVHVLSRVADEEKRSADPFGELAAAVVDLETETLKFCNLVRDAECGAGAYEMKVAAHYIATDVHEIADVLLGLAG